MSSCPSSKHDDLFADAEEHSREPVSCPDCGQVIFVPSGWNWFPAFDNGTGTEANSTGAVDTSDSGRIDPLVDLPEVDKLAVVATQVRRLCKALEPIWQPRWVYSIRDYVILAAIAVVVTAVAFFLFKAILEESPYGTYAFLYERSWVQWVTLTVFIFVLVVLGDRLLRYVLGVRPQISFLKTATDLELMNDKDIIGKRWSRVNDRLHAGGAGAALESVRQYIDEDQRGLASTHQSLKGAASSMAGIGLFGTFMGIAAAFPELASSEQEGFELFVKDLATSLDTTILAMGCLFVSLGLVLVVQSIEKSALGEIGSQLMLALRAKGVDEEAIASNYVREMPRTDMN